MSNTLKIELKKQLICFFLLFVNNLFAQKEVVGIVVNKLDEPISQITVQIKSIDNEKTIAYTITDNKGIFNLEVKNQGLYNLKVTGFGYKTYNEKIEIKEKSIDLGKIILEQNSIDLEEVIIKNEFNGIQEVGDTIKYKIEKFLNGTEETLKDVIKKLPGLDIDQNGKIKANGKEVDKLLIDGEEFFINQQKIATENISATMIKNIELIKNYREFKNIEKNNNSGITAINVKIKDQFKNKLIGNIEVGIGNKFKFHSTLFNFGKKVLFNLISDSNNTGEVSISIDDYYNFTDQKEESVIGEVQFSNSEDLPKFLTLGNNVKSRTSYFTGLNLKYLPIKKIQINAYSIFNTVYQTENQLNTQNYFSNDNTTFINKEIKNNSENTNFNISFFEATYKPNTNNVLSYLSTLTSLNKNEKATIENNFNTIENKYKTIDFSFNHKITFFTIFNNSNRLNLTVKQDISKKTNKLNLISDNPFLNLDFQNNDFKLEQNGYVLKNNYCLLAKYSFNIKKVFLNLFSEASLKSEKLFNHVNSFSDFYNSIKLQNKNENIGTEIKFNLTNKISLTSIFTYSLIRLDMDNQYNNKSLFTPKFILKNSFSSNHYIKLSYQQNNNFPSIESLIESPIINDYRTIYSNENVTYNSIIPNHQFGVDYCFNNVKSNFNLISSASYYKSNDVISNNSITNTSINLLKYKLSPFESNFNSLIYSEKMFKKIPFSIKGSASYIINKRVLFLENIKTNFTTKSFSSYLAMVSRLKKTSFQFELGLLYAKDFYINTSSKNYFSIINPYIENSFKISKNISFVNNFSYKKFLNDNSSRELYLLNPKLKVSFPKSKIEISLIGNNILNLTNKQQISVVRFDNYIEEKISQSLTGYFLFNLKFKL